MMPSDNESNPSIFFFICIYFLKLIFVLFASNTFKRLLKYIGDKELLPIKTYGLSKYNTGNTKGNSGGSAIIEIEVLSNLSTILLKVVILILFVKSFVSDGNDKAALIIA